MRDRETIDSELRLIARGRRSIREQGGQPSSQQVDELLDERLAHGAGASEAEAVDGRETGVVAGTRSQRDKADDTTPLGRRPHGRRPHGRKSHRRKGVLRRVGIVAALPLSLIAAATALVAMFAVHKPEPAAQPTEVPPPPSARPAPAPPKAQDPPLDIADTVFIGALKKEGVPVPSEEYVVSHGHAVCEFLTHQPNFAEAVSVVQRSTIWDANQSADFAAGAIVSYCPQNEPTSADQMQPGFQNALSDLQAIQGDLQGIHDDLQGIPDHLPDPGHQ
jgi:hypothetical protein